MNRVLGVGLVAVALGAFAGCGGPRLAGVSGQVTYRGMPVGEGSIVLEPLNPRTGQLGMAPIEAGAFRLAPDRGVPPGRYRVRITAPDPASVSREPLRFDADGEPIGGDRTTTELLPPRYNRASELTVELVAGENSCDLDLR